MEFVTVDESSKNEHEIERRYGRAPLGQAPEFDAPFVRGVRYSLAAAMSTEGYVATRIVQGSFNSHAFFDFIVDDVVSTQLSNGFIVHLQSLSSYLT